MRGPSEVDSQIFALRFVAVAISIATATLIFRSDANIANRPVTDDGFYGFTVARNVACGKGVTIDGTTLTNGFQPLFTFLSVPAFIIGKDKTYSPIRYVLVLHWLFFFASAYLLALIARDAFESRNPRKNSPIFWWVIVIYSSSVLILLLSFNGLETGCLLFLYACAWRWYQVGFVEKWSGLVVLGALLGALVLARVDAAFFVIVVSLYVGVSGKRFTWPVRFGRFFTVSGTAFFVSSPWWIYNVVSFGSLMPISGRALQAWRLSSERVARAVVAFFQVAMPSIYVGEATLEGTMVYVIRAVLTVVAVAYLWKARHDLECFTTGGRTMNFVVRRTLEFGTLQLLSVALLVIWYTASSFAIYSYVRYFAPMVLVSAMGLGYLLTKIGRKFRHAVMNTVVVGMSIPVLLTVYMFHSQRIGSEYMDQVWLANAYVPAKDWVAAFQSGTLGYFRDNVLNLDGKVNPKVHTHRKNLLGYLEESRVEWLCDWRWSVEAFLSNTPTGHEYWQWGVRDSPGEIAAGQRWRLVATKGKFALFHRELH